MTLKIDMIWQYEVQQNIFRNLLRCMSLPGDIADLSQYLERSSALLGVLATLLDSSVSLSDEEQLLDERERSFLGATISSPERAQFVIRNGSHPPKKIFVPCL